MATALSTYSAFALNNRPSVVEYNRNGQVNFNGAALPSVVNQSWIPAIDATYDLGENSTPRRWRDIWLSRDASVGRNLTVASALTVGGAVQFTNGPVSYGGPIRTYNAAVPDIGQSTARFGTGYFTNLNATGTLTAGSTSLSALTVTGIGVTTFGGPIWPASSGSRDIGANSAAWKDIYITGNIYKNNVLYNPGLSSLGDLIPSADNTYNVGQNSTPLRWKNGYFAQKVYADGGVQVAAGNISITSGDLLVLGGNSSINGNIHVNSLTTDGNLSPTVDGVGTLGDATHFFNNIYSYSGFINAVQPSATGTPVTSTVVGASNRWYENGWFKNVNANTVVPASAAASTVGTVSAPYSDGYFTNLHITNLPTSNFVRSIEAIGNHPYNVVVNGSSTTISSASSDCWATRVGFLTTVSMVGTFTPSGGPGWGTTGPLDIQWDVALPQTSDTGYRGGTCTITYKNITTNKFVTFTNSVSAIDLTSVHCYWIDLPKAPDAAGGSVTWSCVFQYVRNAA